MTRTGIEGYDERQKALRRKFGFQAFWVLIGLSAFDGYVCEFIYDWAGPLVARASVIFLSIFYFGFRSIFSGAYTGDAASERRTAILIPAVGIYNGAMLLALLPRIIKGHLMLIEDGKMTEMFLYLLSMAFFIPFVIAYYIKRYREKSRNGDLD